MTTIPPRAPAWLIWGLGLTQVIGYGTLYYSFGPLAPHLAASFGWPETALFGALAASLLLSGTIAPWVGRLADRHGAGPLMGLGSLAAALALVGCALAPNGPTFTMALLAIEFASAFVLYPLAFAALAQIAGAGAQRQIVHLTLIAGFASTLFWPLTTLLVAQLGWRGTYLVFAGLNLTLCLPVHLALARHVRQSRAAGRVPAVAVGVARPEQVRLLVWIMLAGFALTGVLASSVTIHMVGLLAGLGVGSAGVAVAALFGPAQVASRLINMGWGSRLPQPWLAVIAASLMPLGALVLVLTAPSPIGAMVFALLFGLGSGLFSIVGGTLPLTLFGTQGYGQRLGMVNAGRQLASALAPFLFSLLASLLGTAPALLLAAGAGVLAVGAFASIGWQTRPGALSASPGPAPHGSGSIQ
ncbi:arsenite efflux MFS transporter ArsK [Devosia sp. FKR38]|uniref:arsenite efflux MFS transporter ArsK n=1 Tax=Devosia sp. FKR38 TaxID=2562312 RepID=UPI0010C0FDEF|nr:arsenite efflux MFS transporter ArsK [Devosia sp. FKR38]